MITKEQAMNLQYRQEIHHGECRRTVGPRGGVKLHIETWRVNGRCKTWKTDQTRFLLPIKYGYNGPYDYVDSGSAQLFHLASECPVFNPPHHHTIQEGRGHSSYDGPESDCPFCKEEQEILIDQAERRAEFPYPRCC